MSAFDFSNILIISDMDGTFLGKGGRLVERNLDAIKYFTDNGGKFTFATGRVALSVLSKIPNVTEIVNAPAVLCNGSYMYDFSLNKILAPHYMDSELGYKVVSHINENFPEVDVRMTTADKIWFEKFHRYMKKDAESLCGPNDYAVLPLDKWPKDGWIKFVVRGESEDLDRVRESVSEKFGTPFECYKSNLRFLEYQQLGCTKAGALVYIKEESEREGNPITIIAVGDYENDHKMLCSADIAVCPSNALDSIREVCDYCLCHHDQGVIADIIEGIENGTIKIS